MEGLHEQTLVQIFLEREVESGSFYNSGIIF